MRLAQAAALTAAMELEMQQLYGGEGGGPLCPSDFDSPPGVFLLAERDRRALGCGGLRPLAAGRVELKRMYVEPQARGQGVGRLLLLELVDRAKAGGLRQIWLEVGTEQPAAVGLYLSEGFTPIPSYGDFKGEPMARCFGLEL